MLPQLTQGLDRRVLAPGKWLEIFRAQVNLSDPHLAAAFDAYFGRLVVGAWREGFPTPCIESTYSINPSGYVRFHRPNLGIWYAHVYAYRVLWGPVSCGHEVHHVCENRRCQFHLDARPKSDHARWHNQQRAPDARGEDRRLRKNKWTAMRRDERDGVPYTTYVYP